MNRIDKVEVLMDGQTVGSLALTNNGLCAFEYDADFLRTGQSISPYYLPLQSGVFVAKHHPFDGGFGVFDDSLPDGWGRLLQDRYLQQQGIDVRSLTVLQRLCLVGTNGRGALEYHPAQRQSEPDSPPDFEQLAAEAGKILTNTDDGSKLEHFYRQAGSSGGARPKVFVKIDNREWLVKFKATNDPENIGVIEYEHALLAGQCGIEMPETRLFDGKYFGVERFDRTKTGKIHTLSAAGLLHADYRIPSLDYSILFKVCLNITNDIEQVYALFRLMVFNIAIANRDDHAKNFAFQQVGGRWRLSPAFDLLPSSGFNGFHTTTLNGNGNPTRADISAVASDIGLDADRCEAIVDEIYLNTSRYACPSSR